MSDPLAWQLLAFAAIADKLAAALGDDADEVLTWDERRLLDEFRAGVESVGLIPLAPPALRGRGGSRHAR